MLVLVGSENLHQVLMTEEKHILKPNMHLLEAAEEDQLRMGGQEVGWC